MAKSGAGRSMVVTFEARTDALRKQVGGAESIFQKFGKTAGKVSAGAKAALGTLGVGLGLGAAGKAVMDLGQQWSDVTTRIQTQTGATGAAADKMADAVKAASGRIPASLDDISEATTSVTSSISSMSKASSSQIADVTRSAMAFSQAFEVDVSRAAQVAGQMVTTHLAGNATQAFDLMTAAAQKVPAALREDLMDAVDEYSPAFQQIGFTGERTMSLLVASSAKGMFGLDKTGDAVKELGIRMTTADTNAQQATQSMGLSYDQLAKGFAKGGKAGSAAFDTIVTSLRKIQDPSKRATLAMQLFGTPLEDLNAQDIPKFLAGLQTTSSQLGNTAGASSRLADAINSGPRATFKLMTNQLQNMVAPAASVVFAGVGAGAQKMATVTTQAVSSFTASFKAADGDITSSGFNGVVEAVGGRFGQAFQTARQATDVFVGWWTGRGTDVETSWSEPLGEFAAQLRGIWDTISSRGVSELSSMGTAIKNAFSGAASLLKGVWDVISPLATDVAKLAGAAALGALIVAWQTLKTALDVISPVLSGVGEFLSEHSTLVTSLAVAIGTGVAAWKAYQVVVATAKAVQAGWAAATYGAAAASYTVGAAQKAGAIAQNLWNLATTRGALAAKAQAVAQRALNLVMRANPIGLVIVAITALVAGFIYAYRHSETFRNIVNGALHGVLAVARAVAGWFAGPFVGFFKSAWDGITAGASAVGSFFSGIWNGLKAGASAVGTFFSSTVPGFFTAAWGVIRGAFMAGVTAVTGVLTVLWNAISNTWAFRALQSIVVTVIAIVRWTIVTFVTGVKIIWSAFWAGLVAVARAVWNTIRAIVSAGVAAVRAVIVPVINGIRAVWSVVWGAISSVFRAVWNAIHRFVALKILQVQMTIVRVMNLIRAIWSVAWGAVSTTATRVWNGISGTTSRVFTGIRNRISSIMGAISGIWSRGWNGVKDTGTRLMTSVSSTFGRILGSIKTAFSNTVSAIGKVFGGLKKAVGSPISWVVDHVINKGIIGAIRKVQGFFGVKGKSQMPTLAVPKFRDGGQAPTGYVDAPFSSASRDNLLAFTAAGMPFRYEGGEFITKRASTARSMGLLTAINDGRLDDRIAGFKGGGRLTGGGSGRWTPKFQQTMLNAANILSGTIQIIKKGFLPAGGISGSSHVGDAVDASGADLWAVRDAMRKAGVAAWVRGPKQGFSWHIHGVPQSSAYGSAGGSGIYQQGAYQRHADGLHSYESDIYATRDGKNAGGHWYSGIVGAVKSFAERMADKAKSVFGGLASPVDFLKSKISGLKNSITGALGGSGWAATLATLPAKLWESGSTWVTSKWKSFLAAGDAAEGTPGAAGNKESWRAMVRQALSISGIGSGKRDEDLWLAQIMTESGGNPNLIQSSSLRDINVMRGDPARGLVQVPGVTWADFGKDQGAFLANWMNPLKNLIVGMRAAFAQHGGAAWRRAIGQGRGYGAGTLSAAPGWAWVGEYGPELMRMSGGEQVLTARESAGLQRRSSHIAVADTSGSGPLLSDAQWDELLEAIREGSAPAIVDGASLREAIRSEMRLAAKTEKHRSLT